MSVKENEKHSNPMICECGQNNMYLDHPSSDGVYYCSECGTALTDCCICASRKATEVLEVINGIEFKCCSLCKEAMK